MLKGLFNPVLLLALIFHCSDCSLQKVENFQPEQVHISYGAKPSQMIITWVTQDFVNETVVEYGHEFFEQKAVGTGKIFQNKNSDWTNREITIHSVLLDGLIPGQFYSNSIKFILALREPSTNHLKMAFLNRIPLWFA